METVGQRLRRLRKAKGWTQAEVAERLQVERSTYTKYETDTVEPSLDAIYQLSLLFGLDPGDLLRRDGSESV